MRRSKRGSTSRTRERLAVGSSLSALAVARSPGDARVFGWPGRACSDLTQRRGGAEGFRVARPGLFRSDAETRRRRGFKVAKAGRNAIPEHTPSPFGYSPWKGESLRCLAFRNACMSKAQTTPPLQGEVARSDEGVRLTSATQQPNDMCLHHAKTPSPLRGTPP